MLNSSRPVRGVEVSRRIIAVAAVVLACAAGGPSRDTAAAVRCGLLAAARFSATGSGIIVLDAPPARGRLVTRGRDSEPAWSPDGRTLAFTRQTGNQSFKRSVYVLDTYSGRVRKVSGDVPSATSPAWAADGRRLAFLIGSGVRTIDVRTRKVLFERSFAGLGIKLQWLTGAKFVIELWSGSVLLMEENGKTRTLTTLGFGFDPHVALDAKSLLFVRGTGPAGTGETRVVALDTRSGRTRFVTAKPRGPESNPAWSSDQRWIAFTAALDATSFRRQAMSEEIFIVRSDGTGLRRLTHNAAEEFDPTWNPACESGLK